MSDGKNWSQVSKSSKGKAKKAAAKVENEEGLRKAGVKGMPIEVKQTMYQKAESIEARKAANRQQIKDAQDLVEEKEKNAELAVKESKKAQKAAYKQQHQAPVKEKETVADRCAAIDWNEGVVAYEGAREKFPNKDIEWLKCLVIWCEKSLSGKFAPLKPGEPLSTLNALKKSSFSHLLQLLASYTDQPTILSHLFRICVQRVVDSADKIGPLLLIQVLVGLDRVNCDIVVGSMPQVFKLYKNDIWKDKVALLLIRAYSQTIVNPKLYLQVWQRLQLKLILDSKTSEKVKTLSVAELKTVFPVGVETNKKLAARTVKSLITQHVPTFSVQNFSVLLRVTFADEAPPAIKNELHRVFPILRELTVHTKIETFFEQLLTSPGKGDFGKDFATATHQFLNVCLARAPKTCFEILERNFEEFPSEVEDVLHYLALVWEQPWAASSVAGGRVDQCIDNVMSQINKADDDLLQKWQKNGRFTPDKLSRLLPEMKRTLLEDESSPMLWTTVVLLLLLFVGLVFHMTCRFPPLRTSFTEASCKIADDGGWLKVVDDGYKSLDPYIQQAAPYMRAVGVKCQPYWAVVEPYAAEGLERAKRGVVIAQLSLQPGVEIVSTQFSKLAVVALPYWKMIAKAATPYLEILLATASPMWKTATEKVFEGLAIAKTTSSVYLDILSKTSAATNSKKMLGQGYQWALTQYAAASKAFAPAVASLQASTQAAFSDFYEAATKLLSSLTVAATTFISDSYAVLEPMLLSWFEQLKVVVLKSYATATQVLTQTYSVFAGYIEKASPHAEAAMETTLTKLTEAKDFLIMLLSDAQASVTQLYNKYTQG